MPERTWSTATRSLFLLLSLVWGLNFVFVNFGLAVAGPLWLAMFRAGLGAAGTAVIWVILRPGQRLDLRGRRDAMLLGLPNTMLFFALWFSAARTVLPGVTAVAIYTYPLWVAVLSGPVLAHRLTGRHWISAAVGFSGVALISQVGTLAGASISLLAIAELLLAAVAWAVGTVVFQRRFRRELMLEANLFQLVGGTAGLVVLTLVFVPTQAPPLSPELLGTVVWLGIVGTAVAYSIWYYLLGRTRAAPLSAYLFLVPVVALTASALIFGERLSAWQLIGVVLVLASIYGIGRAPGASDPPRAAAGTES
ncbi:MAG TPA: EamA family transporter [Thermoplasmata archaeon]|nr:EamA family transporter [Thermoplasmata archaeon]